ncbi:MAG: hypothetical protein R2818_12190 [Flavobacteriales bacterium]
MAVRIGRHVNRLAAVTLVLAVLFVFIAVFPEVFERAFIAQRWWRW